MAVENMTDSSIRLHHMKESKTYFLLWIMMKLEEMLLRQSRMRYRKDSLIGR